MGDTVSKINRWQACIFWLLCAIIIPILWVMQGFHAAFGSIVRSHKMALAIDFCGNALLGGSHRQSISSRVGEHLAKGERWAIDAAKVVDFFFGKNHCLDSAKNKE